MKRYVENYQILGKGEVVSSEACGQNNWQLFCAAVENGERGGPQRGKVCLGGKVLFKNPPT